MSGHTRTAMTTRHDWRRSLRHGIGWMLLAKLAFLILLKNLFFSAEHRVPVDDRMVDSKLFPSADIRAAARQGDGP